MESEASRQSLSHEERRRYARHLILPGVGETGQLRLRAARVLVVGAGGLGSPLLLYLAAAGVGRIGLVDPDRVDTSNLQRQVLYTEADRGRLKVEAARERLSALNPLIQIDTYADRLTRHNAARILEPYDIVADGTDNFPTRYLVNDACVLLGKTNVYGSIYRFEGQVAVFNAPLADGGRSPNYRDLFPEPPPPDAVPNCAEGGVLGVLAGIVGSLQANEVIKLITGAGEPLTGRLLIVDAATMLMRTLRFKPRPDYEIRELIDYEQFCGLPPLEGLPEIDVVTFRRMQARGEAFTLIDVRKPAEYARDNLGGHLIPLGELEQRLAEIPRTGTVIVHCQTGARSRRAVERLVRGYGYEQVYNLAGGIAGVRREE